MYSERADIVESTASRERAVEHESTTVQERAVVNERTVPSERAAHHESPVAAERAELHEGAVQERASPRLKSCTDTNERVEAVEHPGWTERADAAEQPQ